MADIDFFYVSSFIFKKIHKKTKENKKKHILIEENKLPEKVAIVEEELDGI